MDFSEKTNIEIEARQQSLDLINKYGLDGLCHYANTLSRMASEGIRTLEGKLSNIKASTNLSD